ncbi:hypothetical protein BASA81_005139 [Batrachochytrium salamandrivorans]|nr:hypothetical protein BASA81_005139 [Batrachochytrium salamandrivorans]
MSSSFIGFAGLGQALWGSEQHTLASLNSVPALQRLKQALLPRQVRFGLGTARHSMSISVQVEGGSEGKEVLEMLNLVPSSQSRPNELLNEFTKQTGAVIVERDFAGRFCKVVIESVCLEEHGSAPFRYSPSAQCWHGNNNPQLEIAREMMASFHLALDEANYMMDGNLLDKLNTTLPEYFQLGVRHQRQGFAHPVQQQQPVKPLRYWMWGVPGIGKTEFIRCFSNALERTIRTWLDPEFTVSVVKVPLNAMSCQTLNHILCIQGLSDWSVERMLEQSLSKGHAVVMHLEESPANCELQDQLNACVHRMLRKLFVRYPEYVANVILIYTSNCEPSANLAKQCVVCHMHPPLVQQRTWLLRKLQAKLLGVSQVVTVAADAYPPTSTDIRPLNSWWLSVSYALLQLGGTGEAFVRATAAGLLIVGWSSTAATTQLSSEDGFFYTNNGDKTDTIFHMCQQGFLTPAVIVMQGTAKQLAQQEDELVARWGSQDLAMVTKVELYSQADEIKVLGDTGEVRGGLAW